MSKQVTLFEFSLSRGSKIENNKKEENKSIQISEERAKSWIEEAQDQRTYYLLQVDYDSKRNKAVMKLYDEQTQKIYIKYDSTGHKPYFIVDLEPEKVRKIDKIIRDPSFDHIEVVRKIDPYTSKTMVFTKIVTKDPLAVRRMRNYVPKAYEAHIRYYNNYIYDLGLIPGMPYFLEKGKLIPLDIKLSGEEIEEVKKAFEDDDELTRTMALEWLPLFESPVPNVKRVAIDIEVYTPNRGRIPDPKKAEFPIISVALVGNDGKKYVLLLERTDINNKLSEGEFKDVRIELFKSEAELLRRVFQLMLEYPVILTFNGDDFDLPYLYYRSLKLGFSENEIPIDLEGKTAKYLAGIHIDLYKFFFNKSVRIYAFEGKYSEYNLDAVAQALLGISKVKVESLVSFLDLKTLAEYNLRDAEITLQLTTFNNDLTWKLIILFARISRMGIEELTRREISTWIKNLYYWEHRKRNILIPLKEEILTRSQNVKTSAIIKGKGYKGAVVIDPPAGVFFNVVVLDFASLYPSIIRNWNLSYETLDNQECKNKKEIPDETGEVLHTVCFDRPGIVAVITGLLRDFRVKIYKKKAKSQKVPEQTRILYDVVQRAMKVFINATYGVFGAENFPLYAPSVAESVTALGRYVIINTIREAEKLGLKVLYGDTDSLFLYNPNKDKLEELVKWVKDNYQLDLEVDKVYKFVAFSGLKKNYLGVYTDGKVEIKGMMAKKRNTPEFIKKEFNEVKNLIISINSPEDVKVIKVKLSEYIKNIYQKLKNKGYNLDELAFRVMLSKPLDSYTKNTPQHVKAGLQLRAFGINVQPRDVIMYVKVKSKEGVKPVQLAKLTEIDVDKYVEALRSTFEQVLRAFGISWDEIVATISIDSFFSKK
ncbi:MAG: DNA-directed DNA polymerase I [Sulfolobaceae archaeon]